jgi:2-phosphoglycerate kinase
MKNIDEHEEQPDLEIVNKEHGLPYSKGLMAQSLMATGLAPERAYHVAREIEQHLVNSGESSISLFRLRGIAQKVLGEEEGESFTERYRRWMLLGELEKPIIILIGGATGVGKSTLATEIAHRLGITRLSSTDAIRQVMRAFFSPELMPAIHYSSFEAGTVVKAAGIKGADADIAGYIEQVEKVSVGVNAVIGRAVREGTRMIVEGAHLVPGFLDEKLWSRAIVIQMILVVEDEERHRGHFYVRDQETDGFRALKKYVDNMAKIRRVQSFIMTEARKIGVPIIDNQSIDDTVKTVMGVVLDTVSEYETSRGLEFGVS